MHVVSTSFFQLSVTFLTNTKKESSFFFIVHAQWLNSHDHVMVGRDTQHWIGLGQIFENNVLNSRQLLAEVE